MRGGGLGGECMLEVLRELPKLVSELLEVPSVGGRACTYVSPWEEGRGCMCVCIEGRWDDLGEYRELSRHCVYECVHLNECVCLCA